VVRAGLVWAARLLSRSWAWCYRARPIQAGARTVAKAMLATANFDIARRSSRAQRKCRAAATRDAVVLPSRHPSRRPGGAIDTDTDTDTDSLSSAPSRATRLHPSLVLMASTSGNQMLRRWWWPWLADVRPDRQRLGLGILTCCSSCPR
jgi:hypothetical protein